MKLVGRLLVAVSLVLGLSGFLMERYVEGTHYTRVPAPEPTSEPTVVELFSYGCPHCRALEPDFEAWEASKPANVKVVREAAAWNPKFESLARFYYTLDALGVSEALSEKVFNTLHNENKPLFTQQEQAAFAGANGVDVAKFNATYGSAEVNARIKHSNDLFMRQRVSGVPAILVNGLFMTDVRMAGNPKELFSVVNFLLPRMK